MRHGSTVSHNRKSRRPLAALTGDGRRMHSSIRAYGNLASADSPLNAFPGISWRSSSSTVAIWVKYGSEQVAPKLTHIKSKEKQPKNPPISTEIGGFLTRYGKVLFAESPAAQGFLQKAIHSFRGNPLNIILVRNYKFTPFVSMIFLYSRAESLMIRFPVV